MADSIYVNYGLSDPFPTVWEEKPPIENQFVFALGSTTSSSKDGGEKSQATHRLQHKFDMFVKMKSTLNAAYSEMRKDFLQESKKWGVAQIETMIDESNVKAAQIMMPIMDNKSKSDRLKATLTLIDKHRYLFDLPGALKESIKRGDNDSLLRDYRRGRALTEEIRTLPHSSDLNDFTVQQRRVVERIWDEVEVVVEEYKSDIWNQLVQTKPDDNYQLYISVLLELGVEDNPIWVWLQAQITKLNERMDSSYADLNTSLLNLRNEASSQPQLSQTDLAHYFLSAIKLSLTDNSIARDTPEIVQMWVTMSEIVEEVTTYFGRQISLFWECAVAFLEGRTQKSLPVGQNGESRVHLSFSHDEEAKIRSDARELVESFAKHIGNFFLNSVSDLETKTKSDTSEDELHPAPLERKLSSVQSTPSASSLLASSLKSDLLSDSIESDRPETPTNSSSPSPPLSPESLNNYELYAFLPPGANAMSSAFFLLRMIGVIASVASELAGLSISSQHIDTLRTILSTIRERCVSAVCLSWQQDAKRFRMLEDWQPISNFKVSKISSIFLAYQGVVLDGLRQIVYATAAEKRSRVQVVMPPSTKLVTNIKTQFVNSIFLMLDGLVKDSTATKPLAEHVDGRQVVPTESRILIMLYNIADLRDSVVSSLFAKFSELFGIQLTDNSNIIGDAIQTLDGQLFSTYTKKKRATFTTIVRTGILKSGLKWSELGVPTDVNPHIYRALLQLVVVHAQVTSVAPSLVRRVVADLLHHLVSMLLETLRQIDKFSLGGMLQATIDVEFVNQKMSEYSSPELDSLYQACYATVQDATDQSHMEVGAMTRQLEDMKRLLLKCHKNSRLEFQCFRKEKK